MPPHSRRRVFTTSCKPTTRWTALPLTRPAVPFELAALVAKMMAKEPERRFQSPKDVAQSLLPFFKKGMVVIAEAARSDAEMSAPGRVYEGQPSTRPTIETRPASSRPVETPPATPRTEPAWEGLIKFKETEPVEKPAPAMSGSARPRRWVLPSVAVSVFLLALFVAWPTDVKVKTPNGIIELVNLPNDADVFIDGEEASVKWPGGGKPAVISIPAGTHKISMKKDGLKFSGDEVTVEAGGKQEFIVRFVPLGDPLDSRGKADDRPAGSEGDRKVAAEPLLDGPMKTADEAGATHDAVENTTTAFVMERGMPAAGVPSKPAGEKSTPNWRDSSMLTSLTVLNAGCLKTSTPHTTLITVDRMACTSSMHRRAGALGAYMTFALTGRVRWSGAW